MDARVLWLHFICVIVGVSECVERNLLQCHEDFTLNPPDGILKEHNVFTWVGFIQYIHVTIGVPDVSRAPRVILIQKQFVLATTKDLHAVPRGYKLGNVIFGQYEQDEDDCGLKISQAKMGIVCSPAYIEMPYLDIIPHPEYTRFGISNSLALVKLLHPLKSHYMLPICLPTMIEREKQRKEKTVFMIDYISPVPTDFDTEKMAKKTFKLYTHKDCRRHRSRAVSQNTVPEGVSHVLCTSGCGVRTGAPITSHVTTGAFELVGIAASSGPCLSKEMRGRFNNDPPIYIDVYPYVNWIINVVMAHLIPLPYPQRFQLTSGDSGGRFILIQIVPGLIGLGLCGDIFEITRTADLVCDSGDTCPYKLTYSIEGRRRLYRTTGAISSVVSQKEGWSKRTYMVGNWCYEKRKKQQELYFFYSEKSEVKTGIDTRLTVNLKISAGIECTICCVRMTLPNRMTKPIIKGVGTYKIAIEFQAEWFPNYFNFILGLTGKNTSSEDMTAFLSELPQPGYWY